MDVQERIKTISESFKELPAAEQNALLKRLKDETSVAREKRLSEIKKEMEELSGFHEQLNPSKKEELPSFQRFFEEPLGDGKFTPVA